MSMIIIFSLQINKLTFSTNSIPPENIRKPEVFLCFQGVAIELKHWLKID